VRKKNKKINWDEIKVTFTRADSKNPNPLNPCSHMTSQQRKEELIDASAKIWQRHCREKLDNGKNPLP